MYVNHFARTRTARRIRFTIAASGLVASLGCAASFARAQEYGPPSVVRKISALSEKIELTTNTSRILTLDKNIPRVQVNNPDLLAVTPLSATQIQISAKKAGVTQVNLWDEEGNIHTVDVMVYGDARELTAALQTQFPHSSIRVYRYSESLVLTGFVDRPDHVGPIMRLAEDYAPKVINNINVGGVQQILLKVKVMEVSRTKLRRLGVDWLLELADGDFAFNSVNEIISRDTGVAGNFLTNNQDTFAFGIIENGDFFGAALDALQQARVAKILAEPNLVAVSGRPAQFNVGGEFPVLIPQSLGTSSIEFKPYGTQVDFLPIVLGNGNIRLEVRPRISEIDASRSIELSGFDIPALTVRQVDTAVEMKAGQTFALAGLVQERVETLNRGLPYLSDLPVIGVPFRRTEDQVNEIELLILVTPEFVDPMDPCETPCGGPGIATTSPMNHDLYCGGHVEVPAHCNPIRGPLACGNDCGMNGCGINGHCANGHGGGHMPHVTSGITMPGGVGFDESYAPQTITDMHPQPNNGTAPMLEPIPVPSAQPMPTAPDDLRLPNGLDQPMNGEESGQPMVPDAVQTSPQMPGYSGLGGPQYTAPRPYSRTRPPVYTRNTSRPNNPQQAQPAAASAGDAGLIGPVGYDTE